VQYRERRRIFTTVFRNSKIQDYRRLQTNKIYMYKTVAHIFLAIQNIHQLVILNNKRFICHSSVGLPLYEYIRA